MLLKMCTSVDAVFMNSQAISFHVRFMFLKKMCHIF